jgi:DNA-binding NtrC family response regulator
MQPHRVHVPLVGVSSRIGELRAEIESLAFSDAKVLIMGESGSGKEVVARQIHSHSRRAGRPFIAINCAGIPETLLESELFGHTKGSFTGAVRDKPGKLEIANGGTIFLDEVGEMSPRMQGLLLRFLETGEIEKVGSDRVTSAGNVRVVSATHRNLHEAILKGLFREDLYYRLNVISLMVPALRDHKEDIPALVDFFIRRAAAESASQPQSPPFVAPSISPEIMAALMAYSWPGNVRELHNVIERLIVGRNVLDVIGPARGIRGQSAPPVSESQESYPPAPTTVPEPQRGRTIADDLFKMVVKDGQPFWTSVYPMYMRREIARSDMRGLVHRGLEEARGNYRIVLRLFNIESKDYKRFLNFLRKHDCRLPFKDYRRGRGGESDGRPGPVEAEVRPDQAFVSNHATAFRNPSEV